MKDKLLVFQRNLRRDRRVLKKWAKTYRGFGSKTSEYLSRQLNTFQKEKSFILIFVQRLGRWAKRARRLKRKTETQFDTDRHIQETFG